LFILDHNFWTRSARKSIKGSKDSSPVSNKNFSEILWPSSWALGQETWAKKAQNYFTDDITHKKSATPNQKNFFEYRLENWPICLSYWTAL